MSINPSFFSNQKGWILILKKIMIFLQSFLENFLPIKSWLRHLGLSKCQQQYSVTSMMTSPQLFLLSLLAVRHQTKSTWWCTSSSTIRDVDESHTTTHIASPMRAHLLSEQKKNSFVFLLVGQLMFYSTSSFRLEYTIRPYVWSTL